MWLSPWLASLRSLRARKAIQVILAFSEAIVWTSTFPGLSKNFWSLLPPPESLLSGRGGWHRRSRCPFRRIQSCRKVAGDFLSIRRPAPAVWQLLYGRPDLPLLHRAAALSFRVRFEFLVLQLLGRESKPGPGGRRRHRHRLRGGDEHQFPPRG